MKTNTLKFLPLLALLVVVLLSGCRKDEAQDDPVPTPPTRTDLLTAKNWTWVNVSISPAIDIDGNGTQENDLTPYFETCDLDDFYKFNANTSFTREEGPSKCDPNAPQVVYTGTWVWNSDETVLTLTPLGGETEEAKVTELTDIQMTWEITFNDNGVNYTQIIILN